MSAYEEVVIPFCDEGMENTLVRYRSYSDFGAFLIIEDLVMDMGDYPMESKISVETAIGLDPTSADSVTIKQRGVVWP